MRPMMLMPLVAEQERKLVARQLGPRHSISSCTCGTLVPSSDVIKRPAIRSMSAASKACQQLVKHVA